MSQNATSLELLHERLIFEVDQLHAIVQKPLDASGVLSQATEKAGEICFLLGRASSVNSLDVVARVA